MSRTRESVLCLSHRRWNLVVRRPQHLLSRCAREHDVVYFEEPMFDATEPELELRKEGEVTIAVPHLAADTPGDIADAGQRRMIDRVLDELGEPRPVLWYYTPAALSFTDHVKARAVVYDWMNEISPVHGAPSGLSEREVLLLEHADLVFTSGHGLDAFTRLSIQHRNIHPFPSSVDVAHFARAREDLDDPDDQAELPRPRIGFFGVIDERVDLELLDDLAACRPELQLVMVGPVLEIDPSRLSHRPNIHWLGGKPYEQLPAYLAGWDVAMLPLVRSDTTGFAAPTKATQYRAAGKPVVSTGGADAGGDQEHGLAWIANTPAELSDAIDEALACRRVTQVDASLVDRSWDATWREMWQLVERVILHASKAGGSPMFDAGGPRR